jgi:hypothetical protein
MFIVCKHLVINNKFLILIYSKLISFLKLILLSIIFISYILLFISLINKSNLLVNIRFINNIISLSIKLNKKVV